MKKRLLSIFLAATMTVGAAGALSSCGGGGNANVDVDEIMSREDVENYVYPEQIEIKIPVYDRGNAGQANVTDNYWTRYVQQEFGDKHNIKVTYISIPRKEEVTMFNQLLAGKPENQPDIIFNYDYPTIISFADQGAFQTLDEEMIKKYAPHFYERTKDLDEYTYVDGEKLFMAGTRPDAYNFITLVRKDWMDKLGIEEPKSTEEYDDMLRKFRDAKLGGEGTIPATASLGRFRGGQHSRTYNDVFGGKAHRGLFRKDLEVLSDDDKINGHFAPKGRSAYRNGGSALISHRISVEKSFK